MKMRTKHTGNAVISATATKILGVAFTFCFGTVSFGVVVKGSRHNLRVIVEVKVSK
jgi:hypothetical protein